MNKFFLFCFLFFSLTFLDAQDTTKQTYLELGTLYFEKSELLAHNYDSCIYYTRLAQTYFEKAQSWKEYVSCFIGLSTVYYWKGDFEQYKLNADLALNTALKFLGKESKYYAYAINNMGVFHNRKGDYNKTIELYNKSLAIQKAAQQPDQHQYIARTYKNLGKVYRYKHDYQESLKYFKKSLAIRNAAGTNLTSSFASDLVELGRCYETLIQPDSALYFYKKSLNTLEKVVKKKQHISTQVRINANQNIASILLKESKPEQALAYIKQALSLQKSDKAYRKATSYELMASYYSAKNQKSKSLEMLAKALSYIRKDRSTTTYYSEAGHIHHLFAKTTFDSGNYTEALQYYQTALQTISFSFKEDNPAKNPTIPQINFKSETLNILTGKAKTLMQLHKDNPDNSNYLQQAFDCYQLCKQLIRHLRQDFLATGSKHLLAAKASPIYEAAIDNAVQLYHQTGETSYLEDAFNSAENNKAILLLESLTEDLAKKSAGIPDSLLEKEYNLTIDLAFYEKTLKLEKQKGKEADGERIKKWEALLFDLQQNHQELISRLERDFPLYYKLKYTDATVSVKEIQQQLAPGSLMLEYFIGEKQSYLFKISPTQLTVEPIRFTSDELEALDRMRKLISQPPDYETAEADFQAYLKDAHTLYLQLLAPALSKATLPKQLVIVPDDLLSYLPFELLLSEADRTDKIDYRASERSYLFNDMTISYDYSASLWRTNQAPPNHQRALQPFAGFAPTFSESIASNDRVCTDNKLYSLKCSQQEVEAIRQAFGGDLFLGPQASKTSFQDLAANYQILHLATHACIDEQNPMLNKIHFTDDYLSNYDLSTLAINAELTVLSACNTGTGKLLEGEGVMSLARNFTQAGCPSTVMSLWSVNDCSTSRIMTHFYAHLAAGQSKNEALQNAKLDYLKTASKMERSPYYWAAFVQFGNSHPLQFNQGGNSMLFYLLGVLILLFIIAAWRRKA